MGQRNRSPGGGSAWRVLWQWPAVRHGTIRAPMEGRRRVGVGLRLRAGDALPPAAGLGRGRTPIDADGAGGLLSLRNCDRETTAPLRSRLSRLPQNKDRKGAVGL